MEGLMKACVLFAAAFLAGCRHGAEPVPAWTTAYSWADSRAMTGVVSRVMDGDTVLLVSGEETNKVRLAGIDAPEKAQPWGPEAKEHLRVLTEGREAVVLWRSKDLYGRIVGELLVDGSSANSNMVVMGMAWQYRDYSKDKRMEEMERSAREARHGLWGQGPEPPWAYRKRVKEEPR
jgi:endonuclease YncB( thermonuclease family)